METEAKLFPPNHRAADARALIPIEAASPVKQSGRLGVMDLVISAKCQHANRFDRDCTCCVGETRQLSSLS